MRKRALVIDDEVIGEITGDYAFVRQVMDDDRYAKGYSLPDEVIDRLIDENIDTIIFVDGSRRYTTDIGDWQDFGRSGADRERTYLPRQYMVET